jgi:hypothetical protein
MTTIIIEKYKTRRNRTKVRATFRGEMTKPGLVTGVITIKNHAKKVDEYVTSGSVAKVRHYLENHCAQYA